jgi:hypothetical protein
MNLCTESEHPTGTARKRRTYFEWDVMRPDVVVVSQELWAAKTCLRFACTSPREVHLGPQWQRVLVRSRFHRDLEPPFEEFHIDDG